MKLSHVSIKCENLAESIEFYQKYFDVRIVHTFFSEERGTYGYFLRFPGGGLIELFTGGAGLNVQKCKLDHFCVETLSIANLIAKIPKRYILVQIHRGKTDNLLQAKVRDPNDVPIEIQQFDELASFQP